MHIKYVTFYSKYCLATAQCQWWAAANEQSEQLTTEAQAID